MASLRVPRSINEYKEQATSVANGLIGSAQPIQAPRLIDSLPKSVQAPINVGYETGAGDPYLPVSGKKGKKPPKANIPTTPLPTMAERLGSFGGNLKPPTGGISPASIGGGAANIGGGGLKLPNITIDDKTPGNLANNTNFIVALNNLLTNGGVSNGINQIFKPINENLGSVGYQFGNMIYDMLGQKSPYESGQDIGKQITTGAKSIIQDIATNNPQVFDPNTGRPKVPSNGVVGGGYEMAFPGRFTQMDKASWEGMLPTDKDPSGAIGKRYRLLQQNLAANESRLGQGEQEALNRRFASMGAQNSGAALRNSQLQGDISGRRLLEQQNALGASESGEKQAAIEARNQRALASAQMKIGSEDSRRAQNQALTQMELGNYQFEKQYGLAEREMALNEIVVPANLEIQKEMLKINSQGVIEQLTKGLFPDLQRPVTEWFT
jgi:hypothetical protein